MKNMSNLMTIKQAADKLKLSTKTLRRWEEKGWLEPDEIEQRTKVRLYSPEHIERWKKFLAINRLLRESTKLNHELNRELDKFNMEQDYKPGQPLKLFDDESAAHYDKVYTKLANVKKIYRWALNELLSYPKTMLEASIDDDKETEI